MRKTPLRRKTWLKRGTKPIPKVNVARQEKRRKVCGRASAKSGGLARNSSLKKVNVARQAKRRERYRKGLAAYKKSECYKIVEARAQDACEGMDTTVHEWSAKNPVLTPKKVAPYRCGAARYYGHRLTHHHLTYSRFGGRELPADIIVLCDRHNREAEAKHPTRQRNYKRSA